MTPASMTLSDLGFNVSVVACCILGITFRNICFLSDDDAVTASDDVLTPATADQSTGKTYSVVLYSSNASCYLMLVACMFVVIF